MNQYFCSLLEGFYMFNICQDSILHHFNTENDKAETLKIPSMLKVRFLLVIYVLNNY